MVYQKKLIEDAMDREKDVGFGLHEPGKVRQHHLDTTEKKIPGNNVLDNSF